jgi:hypothetical protein
MDQEPKVLEICHLCRLVHDEALGGWVSKKAYREATGIDPVTYDFEYSFCPNCYDYLFNNRRAA